VAFELSTDQARYIARMVLRHGRTVAIVAFDADGGVHRDAPLRRAA
jgi:hypothetical protein